MSVAQPDDVANHRHDGSGAGVALGDLPPLIGPRAGAPQLSERSKCNYIHYKLFLKGRCAGKYIIGHFIFFLMNLKSYFQWLN